MSVMREEMTLGGPPRSDRGNWGKLSSLLAVGETPCGVPSPEIIVGSVLGVYRDRSRTALRPGFVCQSVLRGNIVGHE
jgi:hypothetical protein